jgi:hypothetical protein
VFSVRKQITRADSLILSFPVIIGLKENSGCWRRRVNPKASHPVNSYAAPQKAEGGKLRRSTLRNNYFTFASAQMQNAHAEPPRVGEMKTIFSFEAGAADALRRV